MPFGYAGLRKLPKPPSKICHKRKSAVHWHSAKLGTSGASSHRRAAMRLLLAVMNHNRVANRPFESRRETTSLEPSVLSVDMTPTRSPDVPPERRPATRVVRRDISREDALRMHPLGHLRLKVANFSDNNDRIEIPTCLDNHDPRSAAKLRWLPDTGSNADAINLDGLRKLGGKECDLVPDPSVVLNASGGRLTNIGMVTALLSVGDRQIATQIHVYEGLQCPLLSRQSLKKRGILPADLPRSALSLLRPAPGQMPNSEERSEIELIREDIFKEYTDVFSDYAVPTMTGPPMVIKLNDGATPCIFNGA